MSRTLLSEVSSVASFCVVFNMYLYANCRDEVGLMASEILFVGTMRVVLVMIKVDDRFVTYLEVSASADVGRPFVL